VTGTLSAQASPATPPDTMRASVMTGVETLTIEDRPVPTPGAGEVLVEVAAVGVCGSDVHYYRHGRIGDFVVDEPMILGHELSGRIAAVGEGVDGGRIGQRVAVEPQHPCRRCAQCKAGRYNLCPEMKFYATPPIDGAFCRYVTIDDDMAHPVPDSMSDEAAALLEPLSVAITTMRKARVAPGTSILIAGAGPIGVICAQAARAFGASRIVVTDLVASRREKALQFGATEVLDPTQTDVSAIEPVDAFVDATGVPAAVVSGIKAVGPAGHVVLVGMGADSYALPVSHIANLEINVTGVFRYTDTWPAAIHLVNSGAVDLDSMVTGRYGLESVGDALESDTDPASLKSIVRPNE
jgi:L-iditol 2-dehydrogenase